MTETKKTPFYNVGLEYGADMRELFGYYLPWEYSFGHHEEHTATRERVSVCDLHYMGEMLAKGPDAFELVQKICTSDLANRKPGSIKYTTFCNSNGLMHDDGTIWKIADDEYLIITGDEKDYEWISSNAADMDVEVTNITDKHTTLAIQGPNSKDTLQKLTDVNLGAIPYYNFLNGQVAGIDCRIARMGYTGEFGYELHLHPDHGENIWNALMKAGGEYKIMPLGQAGLESLRQEAGYLLVGNDHDKNTNPFEAGLGGLVQLTKKDFNGKQALQEILEQGISRTMVWFRIPDGTVAENGDGIFLGDKKIGQVTSGSFSPTFKRGTAMGYVQPQYAIQGAKYTIKTSGKSAIAILSSMPLYDPGNTKTIAKK